MFLTNCKEEFQKLQAKIKEEESKDNLAGAKKDPHVRKCNLDKILYTIPDIEIPKTLSVHETSEDEEAEEEE